MVKVEGIDRIQKMFAKSKRKYGNLSNPSVTVGYTQHYALLVHEMVGWRHEVGQAKYLEQPLRTEAKQIGHLVTASVAMGATLLDGLIVGGLYLQAAAQDLTPVDTGALKASAFTSPTENVEDAAKAAYERSEKIRVAELKRRGVL